MLHHGAAAPRAADTPPWPAHPRLAPSPAAAPLPPPPPPRSCTGRKVEGQLEMPDTGMLAPEYQDQGLALRERPSRRRAAIHQLSDSEPHPQTPNPQTTGRRWGL